MSGEVSFEEFWSLKEKLGQGQRFREITIKVVKAENVLNAGRMNAVPVALIFHLRDRW